MGRYRSLQSIMLAEALKGITDNQTITAYKKDCKLFAAYCKEQGVKRPDQLQGKEKELLQGYEKQLEASGYSPGANLVIDEADRKVREVIEKYDGDPKFTGSTGGHYVSIKMNANGRFLDSLEAKYADETVEDVTITTLSKKEYTKMQQKTAEEAENEGVEVTEVGNLGINAKSTNNGSPAAKYAKAYSERMSTVNPEFE